MKKKFFLLSLTLSVSGLLFAQNEERLVPLSSFGVMANAEYPSKITETHEYTSQKGTIAKQRLIASSIYNVNSGNGVLADTAQYLFSGLRGSYGSQTGAFSMVSNYDSAFAFDVNNSLNPIPRATQFYNAADNRTSFYNYRADGTISGHGWTEYHPNDGFKRNGSVYFISPADTIYRDAVYRPDGQLESDTFNQIANSQPIPNLNWDKTRKYEFDAQGRKIFVSSITNTRGQGGSHLENIIWYFYDNANQQYPARDSSIFVINSSVPAVTSHSYSYDGMGRIIQRLEYGEPSHQLTAKWRYTYNTSSKMLTLIVENYSAGQLSGYSKQEYVYNDDVLVERADSSKDISSNVWTETYRIHYNLNADLLAESVEEYFNGVISQKSTYTYNDFKNIVDEAKVPYNNGVPGTKSITHNYYEIYEGGPATGINNPANQALDVQLFPNPTTDKIQLAIPKLISTAQISICNLTGTVLYNRTTSSKITMVDLVAYSKGIYLIKIVSKQGIFSSKIVKK